MKKLSQKFILQLIFFGLCAIFPLPLIAADAQYQIKPNIVGILLGSFIFVLLLVNEYVILDKLYTLIVKKKSLDPFSGVTSWRDYYSNLPKYIVGSLAQSIGSSFLLIFLFAVQLPIGILIIVFLSFLDTIPGQTVSYAWSSLWGVGGVILTAIIGMLLIKFFQKCTFKEARLKYFIKLIPIVIIMLVSVIVSRGHIVSIDEQTGLFTIGNTNSEFFNNSNISTVYITSVSPLKDSKVTKLDSVKITFSDSINMQSANNNTIYVLQGIEDKVPGTLSRGKFAREIIFTPTTPITTAQRLTVVVEPGVQSTNGRTLGKQELWNIDVGY